MDENKKLAVALVESSKIAQLDEDGRPVASMSVYYGLDMKSTQTQITDITAEAARAQIEVAKYEHAIPAQEETKRDGQYTWRHAMVCIVVLVGIIMVYNKPEAGQWIVGLVAVLGGVYGWTAYVAKKRPNNEGQDEGAGRV